MLTSTRLLSVRDTYIPSNSSDNTEHVTRFLGGVKVRTLVRGRKTNVECNNIFRVDIVQLRTIQECWP